MKPLFPQHLLTAVPASLLLLAPAGLLAADDAPPNPPARPNVLFIAVDDLRPDLAAFGGSAVKSPNLDQLAAEAVVFNRAYAQFPVCMPSRASVLSGYRPESINDTPRVSGHVPKGTVTLPQLFRDHGYETVSIGKIYHANNDDPAETHNLAKDPKHAKTLKSLEAAMKAGWRAARPQPTAMALVR